MNTLKIDLMVALDSIQFDQEYQCQCDLNIYKSPAGDSLVTQAEAGRQLHVLAKQTQALWVCTCDDDYPGWLPISEIGKLSLAAQPYQAATVDAAAIQALVPTVIQFAQAAMATPNTYRWGGTVAPHYDCSGLMQAAFRAVGVQLPRDSYQQETFVQPVELAKLQAGDLIFFGTPERATHVALYWEDGRYIHSSGKAQGRNGIGVDSIQDLSDPISRTYFQQLRMCGRVVKSYQSTGQPMQLR
ncbi:MAG: C40 family peptidase [Cyanobacteria bacterium J06638_28]